MRVGTRTTNNVSTRSMDRFLSPSSATEHDHEDVDGSENMLRKAEQEKGDTLGVVHGEDLPLTCVPPLVKDSNKGENSVVVDKHLFEEDGSNIVMEGSLFLAEETDEKQERMTTAMTDDGQTDRLALDRVPLGVEEKKQRRHDATRAAAGWKAAEKDGDNYCLSSKVRLWPETTAKDVCSSIVSTLTTMDATTSSDDVSPAAALNEMADSDQSNPRAEEQQQQVDSANGSKLDPVGSLRPSSTTKLDALVAAATAEMVAREIEEKGTYSESGTSDDNGDDDPAEEAAEATDLQQKPKSVQPAAAAAPSRGAGEREGTEEEKKETSKSEDAMDGAPNQEKASTPTAEPIAESEDDAAEEVVNDKSEISEESLEPEEVNDAGADADANDSHSPSDTSASKTPVDASGICSLERDGNEESFASNKDPPETIIEENQETDAVVTTGEASATNEVSATSDPPNTVVEEIQETDAAAVAPANEEASATKEASLSSEVKEAPVEPSHIDTPRADNTSKPEDIVPPILDNAEKEASDAVIAAVTMPILEGGDSPTPQLPRDLLANKDKEGFGLLARGESFNGVQHQDYSPPHQYDDASRLPQEPDAEHRRGDSSFASMSNHGPAAGVPDDNGSRMLDDNSGRPIDDWRPSQTISYPASPQEMRNSQAIAFSNGGYMVMPPPHNQGQPPHAFIAQPPAMLHHQSSFHSHQAHMIGQTSFGYQAMPAMAPLPSPLPAVGGGKRKIKLILQEEILARPSHARRTSFFFGGRSTRNFRERTISEGEGQVNEVDRGTITVSWFEGTSSLELQEHVNRSVSRKLKLQDGQTLDDIRIMDCKVDPPEGRFVFRVLHRRWHRAVGPL